MLSRWVPPTLTVFANPSTTASISSGVLVLRSMSAVRATDSRLGRVRSVRRTIRMASWRALVSTASPRSTGRRSEEVSRKTLALTSYLFGISRTATHPTRQMTAAAASPAQR